MTVGVPSGSLAGVRGGQYQVRFNRSGGPNVRQSHKLPDRRARRVRFRKILAGVCLSVCVGTE